MERFLNYLKETKGELQHVSWPSQAQTITFTALVIAISILTAFYLGFFDYLFTLLLQKLLEITG